MSIPADTLRYDEIRNAMEVLEAPESELIVAFLDANKESINEPEQKLKDKPDWEDDSPVMERDELRDVVGGKLSDEEFESAFDYLTEKPVSRSGIRYSKGRLFDLQEDNRLKLPRTGIIDNLGSLLIEGQKPKKRKAVDAVLAYENGEAFQQLSKVSDRLLNVVKRLNPNKSVEMPAEYEKGLTMEEIEEYTGDSLYLGKDITQPLGFLHERAIENEEGEYTTVYSSNLDNRFMKELYEELSPEGSIDIRPVRRLTYTEV